MNSNENISNLYENYWEVLSIIIKNLFFVDLHELISLKSLYLNCLQVFLMLIKVIYIWHSNRLSFNQFLKWDIQLI